MAPTTSRVTVTIKCLMINEYSKLVAKVIIIAVLLLKVTTGNDNINKPQIANKKL